MAADDRGMPVNNQVWLASKVQNKMAAPGFERERGNLIERSYIRALIQVV
jgi:hypothetical protein